MKFEQLDKTDQYAIALPLLKTTTPASRLIRLKQAITKLETSAPGKRGSTPR